jgi:hypothetical protein
MTNKITLEMTEDDLEKMASSDEVCLSAGPPTENNPGLKNCGLIDLFVEGRILRKKIMWSYIIKFYKLREQINLEITAPLNKNITSSQATELAMYALNARAYNFRRISGGYWQGDFYEDRTYKLVDDSKK